MKYVVILSAIISFGLIFTGLYFDINNDVLKDRFYGLGTISMFFITFPLFLFWRRNKFTREKFIWKNPNLQENEKEKTED